MARRHLDAYSRLEAVNLSALVGRTSSRAEQLAAEFGVSVCYRTLEKALAVERFDIASVCLPTSLHPETTIALLQAGIHVLTEKPIALTETAAQRMIETAEAENRKLSVVFNRRFGSSFAEYSSRLSELGRPLVYRVEDLREIRPKRAMHDKRRNGGPIIDCACHDFDLLLHLFGPVESVYATGHSFATPGELGIEAGDVAVDTGNVSLRFENGFSAEIFYGWGLPSRPEYWIRRTFLGPGGMLTAEGDFGQTVEHYRRDGVRLTARSFVPDGHRNQIERFVAAVRDDTDVPVPPGASVRALHLSLSALESMESGKVISVTHNGAGGAT